MFTKSATFKSCALALVAFLGMAADASHASENSWMSLPEIVNIRGLYNHTQAQIRSGQLNEWNRVNSEHQCSDPVQTHSQTLWVDEKGRVVSYRVEWVSEHSSRVSQAYYDTKQSPRFIFTTHSSYYELTGLGRVEYRTYFDPTGKLIKHDTRELDAGILGGDPYDHRDLVGWWLMDPKRHFVSETCNSPDFPVLSQD